VRCPDPAIQESRFISFLYEWCRKRNDLPVIFPTHDSWAAALSRHLDLLREVARPCVGSWEVISSVIEKDVFYRLGMERGYGTPYTWKDTELDDIPADAFPIVAKPKFRLTASNRQDAAFYSQMNRLRLTKLHGKCELDAYLQREAAYLKHIIFQEYVAGMSDRMYTVGVYTDANSNIMGLFTGRKVRGYPALEGDCIVGESYPLPDAVVENTRRVIKELGLSGIMEIEYKQSPETGEFKLIEINPRSWSWVGITPACGVSLPWIAYRDLCGKDVHPLRSMASQSEVRYIKLFQDMRNCLFRYRSDYPVWAMTWHQWWQETCSQRHAVIAEFHARDTLVAILSVGHALFSLLKDVLGAFKERQNDQKNGDY